MNKFDDFTEIKSPTKVHRCAWCPFPIEIGTTHLKFVGRWNNEFQNWRIHLECREPLEKSELHEDMGEICFGPHARGGKCEC